MKSWSHDARIPADREMTDVEEEAPRLVDAPAPKRRGAKAKAKAKQAHSRAREQGVQSVSVYLQVILKAASVCRADPCVSSLQVKKHQKNSFGFREDVLGKGRAAKLKV